MSAGVTKRPPTKGSFKKGNPGGPGNPYVAQLNKIRSKCVEVLTPEIMAGIFQRAAADALKGNASARDFCTEQLFGKTPQPLLVAGMVAHDFAGLAGMLATADKETVRQIEARVIDGLRAKAKAAANGKGRNGHPA